MSEAESYAAPYRDPADVGTEVRLLRSRRAGIVRVSHGGGVFSDPPADAYLLTTPLQGSPYVECTFAGYRLRDRTYPGDLILQPIQDGASGEAEGAVTIQMMAIDGPWLRGLHEETARGSPLDLEALSAQTWRDPLVFNLIERIWEKIDIEGTAAQAWVDSAMALIARTLFDRAGQPGPQREGAARLSVAQVDRLRQFVEANLAEPIGIAEMAAEVGLSQFHFIRAFKAARHQTPHQFMTMCRLERARLLVQFTENPLAGIAYATGFSSQAHMTTRFRQVLGVTPGALRRRTAGTA
jgi:AraC family transcriptional regulator